jgi:hypothetical protein
VNEVKEWFRWIKTFDGKAENRFLADGKTLDREETLMIISDCQK